MLVSSTYRENIRYRVLGKAAVALSDNNCYRFVCVTHGGGGGGASGGAHERSNFKFIYCTYLRLRVMKILSTNQKTASSTTTVVEVGILHYYSVGRHIIMFLICKSLTRIQRSAPMCPNLAILNSFS